MDLNQLSWGRGGGGGGGRGEKVNVTKNVLVNITYNTGNVSVSLLENLTKTQARIELV